MLRALERRFAKRAGRMPAPAEIEAKEAGVGGTMGEPKAHACHTWDHSITLEKLRNDICQFVDDRGWHKFHTSRNLLLALVGEVGEVSEIFQWKGEVDNDLTGFSHEERTHLGEELSDVLFYLLRLADVCKIDLGVAAGRKLLRNQEKYPVSKSSDDLGEEAAATTTGQVAEPAMAQPGGWDREITLESLKGSIRGFAEERGWHKFQTPRNLLLALVGEVGEVSEIFQWKGEVDNDLTGFSQEERTHLGEELSDVLFYLLRLADVCKIDLGVAAGRKLLRNQEKYPVAKCYGRSTKYNKL